MSFRPGIVLTYTCTLSDKNLNKHKTKRAAVKLTASDESLRISRKNGSAAGWVSIKWMQDEDDGRDFSTVHSSRCADRVSALNYEFMAAQCSAGMFVSPAAKCYWWWNKPVPWVSQAWRGDELMSWWARIRLSLALCRLTWPHALSSPLSPRSPRLTLCLAPDRIPGVSMMLMLSRTWLGIWAHWNLDNRSKREELHNLGVKIQQMELEGHLLCFLEKVRINIWSIQNM